MSSHDRLEGEAWLRLLSEACTEGVLVHQEGRILQVSSTLARMFGYAPREMVGMMGDAVVVPDDRARLMRHIAERSEHLLEGTALRKDGSTFPADVLARNVVVEGRPVRVAVVRDLTEQKAAEAERREQEARYLLLVRQLPAIMWTTDAELRVTAIEGLLPGIAAAAERPARIGRPLTDVLAGADDPEAVLAAHRRALAGEPAGYRFSTNVRTYEAQVEPMRDERGRVTGVIGVAIDISAQVRAVERASRSESALRRSRRELLALTENSPDIFTRYDREHRVRFMSRAVEQATGIPYHWFLGRSIREFGFPPPLAEQWMATSDRVFATGAPEEMEFDFIGPDGVPRTYHTRIVPERGEGGEIETVLTTTRDITARKRAEAAARAADATLRGLVEQSLTGIYVIQGGRFRYVNPRFAEIFGYPGPAAVLALPDVGLLVAPEDRATVTENLRRRTAGETRAIHYSFRGVRLDGSPVVVEVYGSGGEHDGLPAVVGTLLDITEKVRLEEQLRQAQKMEAVGQLAGGVAHDFNNILAAITGYAQLLRTSLPAGDQRREDAEEIIAAATRGAAVTKQLLAFSRRQAIETEVLDLAAVVRDMGRMLRTLLPPSIALDLPAPAGALVRASRSQLEQIVLNLVVNARDAMPDGGTLTIAVSARRAALGGAFAAADAAPGAGLDLPREAVLVVRDTGTGIPEAIRDRIFDPFFTTKPPGRGTGLGLATVYGLVRQFGGSVAVESRPGAGTEFTIALPLVPAAGPAGAAAPAAGDAGAGGDAAGVGGAAPGPATARRRILVVEDELQVRAIAARALAGAGYGVAESPNGAAALERLRAGEPFDLVLTDAAMPDLGGRELAAAVAELRPGLPVVLMSGYAELSGAGAGAGLPGVTGFIEKPFTMQHLLEVVRGAIHHPGGDTP